MTQRPRHSGSRSRATLVVAGGSALDLTEGLLGAVSEIVQAAFGGGQHESGEYPIRRPDLMALLDLYGVSDRSKRDGLLRLSEDEYAETVITAAEWEAEPAQIARWVQLRMDRQAVLHQEAPPRLTAIIDKFVLRREIGGPDVQSAQLTHLLATAQLPHMDLRVLPASIGAHAGHSGLFQIFTIAEPDMDVGYAESVGGAVYVELPDSERFVRVYDRLLDSALGPAESAQLIRAIGEDLL